MGSGCFFYQSLKAMKIKKSLSYSLNEKSQTTHPVPAKSGQGMEVVIRSKSFLNPQVSPPCTRHQVSIPLRESIKVYIQCYWDKLP